MRINIFRNHIKIAIRRLFRNPLNTFIIIVGLSVGFASVLILLHFTSFELSFDQFHTNKDEIYRVVCYPNDGVKAPTARNYTGTGLLLRDKFPEVKQVVQFWRPWNRNDGEALKARGQIHYEQKIIQSDSSFFQVFPSLLKSGDSRTVLSEPNSIVISESKANSYFGNEDPMGQLVSDGELDLKVTGIMYDAPKNSHLDIEFVRTYYDDFFLTKNWKGFYLYTYLTVDPNVNIEVIESKLADAVQSRQQEFDHLANVSFELQPITAIHLGPNLSSELTQNTDKTLVYFLFGIGVIILMMAWINHINLSVSSFFGRTKELSIRGVIGASQLTLSRQLLVEFLLLNFLALPMVILLILLSNRFLVEQGQIPNMIDGLYNPLMWLITTVLLIIGSAFIGLFPYYLIRKINFAGELKSRSSNSISGIRFKSTMVIIQFVAAIILVSGVVIMRLQLKHLKSGDKHMKIDRVIAIRNPTAYSELESESVQVSNYNLFKEKLTNQTAIEYVASSSAIPGSPVGYSTTDGLRRIGGDPNEPTKIKVLFVDSDFLDVYSIPLLAGRSFSELKSQDLNEQSLMLSEETVKHLGFSSPEEALGQHVEYHIYTKWNKHEIIGVYKDYAHESAKSEAFPSMLYFSRYETSIMHHLYHSIKVADDADTERALAQIKETWVEVWPEKPFEFHFIDQVYEAQYQSEKVLSTSFTFFSIVAIVLACLGILGITHYELQAKLREISIRKVLGSTITDIFRLLSSKYLYLILISACLAIPISFWLGLKWLENYPIKIPLSFWIFLIPVGLILGLVFLTTGSMIFKGANTNPAKVLRSE